MSIALLFWQLFEVFFIIGLFNFGGGGAMLSLIQTQVVGVHGWLTEEAFTNIVAISQSTPGPIGINCATYVGYEVLHGAGASQIISTLGSATATFAVVLPSFIVFFAIIKLFNRFHQHPTFITMMKALKPVVAGLIGAAALILIFKVSWVGALPRLSLLRENFADWTSWALFALALGLGYSKKLGPITLIVIAGIIGALIY